MSDPKEYEDCPEPNPINEPVAEVKPEGEEGEVDGEEAQDAEEDE